MRRSIALPLALLFAAGAAWSCPDASKNADARPALLDKSAAAPAQMTPAPGATKSASNALLVKPTAAKPAAATAAAVQRKPAGG